MRLLDAEGMAKFSMRRLAAELNVTAMSVYWYVDTKDDLLELALDAVFGELELPDPESGEDWRDQLRALAAGYRALLVRHPWVSPLIGTFLNIGPHSMAFSLRVQEVDPQDGAAAARTDGRALRGLPVRVRLRHDRGPLRAAVRLRGDDARTSTTARP